MHTYIYIHTYKKTYAYTHVHICRSTGRSCCCWTSWTRSGKASGGEGAARRTPPLRVGKRPRNPWRADESGCAHCGWRCLRVAVAVAWGSPRSSEWCVPEFGRVLGERERECVCVCVCVCFCVCLRVFACKCMGACIHPHMYTSIRLYRCVRFFRLAI